MNTEFQFNDIAALSPLLIILVGSLIVLLCESFLESFSKKFAAAIAFITIAIAFACAVTAPPTDHPLLSPWLRFDAIARIFSVFFLAIGLFATLLSAAFFQRFEASRGEFFFLLLSALFGLLLIGSAADFLTLFLGIETLSISLYILCGYMKKWNNSPEASVKYFLMGSLAAAFLLYGIALIYGATGTTNFQQLLAAYQAIQNSSDRSLFFAGTALVTLGLAFEAAIVPLHLWAPDVYEGASTPVTAFMAVGTKVGAFAAFVRVFYDALPHFHSAWNNGIALLIYPTLIYANFVALRQTNLRRFFAYSGISHAGFLLIPLAAGTSDALPAMIYYLVVYALATFGCFAILAFVDQRSEGVVFHDLQGLFRRSPFLAAIFSLCLLTLGGIPPTAGFFAKFFIFKEAFVAGYYGLVIVGLLTTILSAFYYLRIIAIMLAESTAEMEARKNLWPAYTVAVVSLAGIILLTCYPAPLLDLISK